MRTAQKSNAIYNFVLRGIESGKFRINERIPTERELAIQFRMSRPTVGGAINRLVSENLIRRNGKAGSTVIATPPRRTLSLGAILIGLGTQHREETVCDTVAKELTRRAGTERAFVLTQDPSWTQDPGESGVFNRYREIAGELIRREVAGVFLMPQEILPDQFVSLTAAIVEDFREASIPVLLIDRDIVRYPARSPVDLVGIDNFGAGFTLTRHFLELGCRSIDFFAHTSNVPTQEARIDGYQRAMESFGLHPDAGHIQRGDLFNRDFVVDALRRRKPEAVVVVSDSRAAPVMEFALDAGIQIPEQIRLGSFDDLPMSSHLPVPLTTIRQPAAGVAAVALRTLLHRIDEPGLPASHAELCGELIVRRSSGIAATQVRRVRAR